MGPLGCGHSCCQQGGAQLASSLPRLTGPVSIQEVVWGVWQEGRRGWGEDPQAPRASAVATGGQLCSSGCGAAFESKAVGPPARVHLLLVGDQSPQDTSWCPLREGARQSPS